MISVGTPKPPSWLSPSGTCSNAIDHDSGLKVDFWILPDDGFARSQFGRRKQASFDSITCWVASAEDTILSKLLWYRMSSSERQLSDVRAIVAIASETLDYGYLREWADKLGLTQELAMVQAS